LRFRYLTARKCDEMEDKLEAAKTYKDIPEALSMALAGWENVKHPDTGNVVEFDPSQMLDVFSRAELHELRDDITSFMTMDGLAKKKAALQSQHSGDTSAKSTATASA